MSLSLSLSYYLYPSIYLFIYRVLFFVFKRRGFVFSHYTFLIRVYMISVRGGNRFVIHAAGKCISRALSLCVLCVYCSFTSMPFHFLRRGLFFWLLFDFCWNTAKCVTEFFLNERTKKNVESLKLYVFFLSVRATEKESERKRVRAREGMVVPLFERYLFWT